MTQPVEKIEDIPNYPSVGSLKRHLTMNGCHLCSLGFQPEINGCCVARGSELTNKMIIGEAPGKEEDSTGTPFSGPAGRLMDEIWKSVGMDTNDWYITNVVLCRPYSPRGSGKENFTPKKDQQARCKVYLDKQIALIKPQLIVTIGAIATQAILGPCINFKMGDYRGKCFDEGVKCWDVGMQSINPGWQKFEKKLVFPMIHPAAILHAKGSDKYDLYREQTWQDIKTLKMIMEDHKI
jgi:uracil-DNA glycosylase family 4